jgi:TonB-linked SusC/RagA family outer membrane protein
VLNSQELYQLRLEAVGRTNGLDPMNLAVKRNVLNAFRVVGANTMNDKQADSAAAVLPTYDWQDAAFNNSTVKNYELSVSGGAERTTYRVSGSYSKQGTFVTNSDFSRGGLKFDIGTAVNSKINFNTSVNMSLSTQRLPFSIDASTIGNPAFSAPGVFPTNPIYNPDGTFYGIPIYNPASLSGTLNQNVIATTALNSGNQKTNQIVGNFSIDYKLAAWLTFRTFFGIDYRNLQGRRVTDPRTADGFARKGLTQTQTVNNTNWNNYETLNFNTTINSVHRIDGLLGYEYRNDNQYSLSASGDGFPTFEFSYLNNAANPISIGEFTSEFKRNALFGSINYSYGQRYVLGLVGRYDGSSRFSEGNRYGFFGGIKAAWNIDKEDFMGSGGVFSTLRLRASWGTTGNDQVGNFDALGLFGGGGVYNSAAGIAYTQLANPDLKWEKNRTGNIGVDFGLFRNRITGTVEVYDKTTSDLLLNQPLQLSSGFSSFASNIGKMRNRGIELTLGGDVIKTRGDGFNWNLNFIWSFNKNEVLDLYGGQTFLPINQGVTVPSNFPAAAWVQVGQPMGVLFTQLYAGVNPATGRAMWYDSLGNLAYQISAKDRKLGGSTLIPLYQGGLRSTMSYKGFTLEGFFQYEYGRYESDGQINFLLENVARINMMQAVYENRWTKPGQITSFPRMNTVAETKNSGAQGGDRLWFKADYIRLKNLLISYDIPSSILRKARISSARFYVQATNLWTYNDWYSYDVEFSRTTTGNPVGIIPQSKNYTVGIQVGL